MKYLSCSDAAKAVGITPRRIQQMCMEKFRERSKMGAAG